MLITFFSFHPLGPSLQPIASSSDLASNSRIIANILKPARDLLNFADLSESATTLFALV